MFELGLQITENKIKLLQRSKYLLLSPMLENSEEVNFRLASSSSCGWLSAVALLYPTLVYQLHFQAGFLHEGKMTSYFQLYSSVS